ncbi:MAG: beta-galactosidase, partial [Gammaproteobacteria bacterium]|nr:beta-galactosidase [Gammaproteobacteria bacterium]
STPIGGAAGASIRIIEHFLYRQLPGVVIGDPTASGGLRMASTSNDLAELGKPWTLNSRYQEFLLRRYSALTTEAQPYALEILNTAWHTSFEDFRDIVFSTQIPDSSYQRPDWMLFVQRELATVGKWQPEQGVWSLHIRYQEWLRKHYQANHGEQALTALNEYWQSNFTAFEEIRFSPLYPQHKNQAKDWQRFIQKGLGFNYAAVNIEDTSRYQEFLARRYRHIDTLNSRYELQGEQAWASFRDISLPAEDAMPAQSTALHDWIQFVSLNLPIHRNAHQFTVLVPTVPGELPSSRENRLQQVEEIVRTEKPAHTQFDVRLYWALFQVGSARLGLDTTIGSGSRYVAVVLGSTYLGQGVLEHGHPWNINQRQVIGRDRIQRSIQGENNNE